MANCLKCGAQIPSFSFGNASPLCRDCNAALAEQAALEAARKPPEPRRRDAWADLPRASEPGPAWLSATYLLVAVNVSIFVAMVVSGIHFFSPKGPEIIPWGSDFGPATLTGQYWRVLTSAFIHFGILHLGLNMWCLAGLGELLERLFGKLTTILVYLVTGAGASLLSLTWQPLRNSAGASGAIFGFAGVLISFFFFAKLDLPKERVRGILGMVTRFAVINLIIGLSWRIDNMAHLGGLITGLILGLLFALSYNSDAASRVMRQVLGLTGVAAALAGSFAFLVSVKAEPMELVQAQVAMLDSDYSSAIPHLQKATALKPNDAVAHGMLGYALAGAQRYDEAMQEYRRALALQPGYPTVQVNMAATMLRQGHPEEAVALFRQMTGKSQWESEDYRYYGEALRLTGSLNEAEAALKQAVSLDPKDALPHQQLAILYRQMGKPEAAEGEEKTARNLAAAKKKK